MGLIRREEDPCTWGIVLENVQNFRAAVSVQIQIKHNQIIFAASREGTGLVWVFRQIDAVPALGKKINDRLREFQIRLNDQDAK